MYYVLYTDRSGQWRWRLVAANYKTIADSAEGYWNETDCRNAINLVKGSGSAPVIKQ